MEPNRVRATVRALAVATAFGTLAGCASAGAPPGDPFEGANRAVYGVQTGVVDPVFDQVALGYRGAVPEAGREGVHNLLTNLERPTSFLNHVLQADPVNAATTAAAFAVDTTVGLLGIWRPSERWGVVDEEVGFADTLSMWGIGRGVYHVVPFLGSGTSRQMTGRVVDALTDPTRWVLGDAARWSLTGATVVDVSERTLDGRRRVAETEADPYAATRTRFLGDGSGDRDEGVRFTR